MQETSPTNPTKAQRFLDTESAAEYLGLSPRTLERWRLEEIGPDWFKMGGRCLYSPAMLDSYAASCLVVTKKTDHGGAEHV